MWVTVCGYGFAADKTKPLQAFDPNLRPLLLFLPFSPWLLLKLIHSKRKINGTGSYRVYSSAPLNPQILCLYGWRKKYRGIRVQACWKQKKHTQTHWTYVFGSIFVFSSFYRLDLHNETRCCVSRSATEHWRKPGLKSDLPYFRYGYRKCVLLDFLTGYTNT